MLEIQPQNNYLIIVCRKKVMLVKMIITLYIDFSYVSLLGGEEFFYLNNF